MVAKDLYNKSLKIFNSMHLGPRRAAFWANCSSILGGSRDHIGVILGSSFKGSLGVPDMKKMTNFWVFENMSRDPPEGLLGPLGGFSFCRFHKILEKFWGSQNRTVEQTEDRNLT